jgi:hypothetical protein
VSGMHPSKQIEVCWPIEGCSGFWDYSVWFRGHVKKGLVAGKLLLRLSHCNGLVCTNLRCGLELMLGQ